MSSAFFFSDYFLIFIYFHPFIDFKVFFPNTLNSILGHFVEILSFPLVRVL